MGEKCTKCNSYSALWVFSFSYHHMRYACQWKMEFIDFAPVWIVFSDHITFSLYRVNIESKTSEATLEINTPWLLCIHFSEYVYFLLLSLPPVSIYRRAA